MLFGLALNLYREKLFVVFPFYWLGYNCFLEDILSMISQQHIHGRKGDIDVDSGAMRKWKTDQS